MYPLHIIRQFRIDAEFPSLPTAFPEACDAKYSPAIPVVLTQKRPSRITCAGILTSPLVSGAEHVVCDVVVHVHTSAHVAGYNRHLQFKHKLFIMEFTKNFTEVTEPSPFGWYSRLQCCFLLYSLSVLYNVYKPAQSVIH